MGASRIDLKSFLLSPERLASVRQALEDRSDLHPEDRATIEDAFIAPKVYYNLRSHADRFLGSLVRLFDPADGPSTSSHINTGMSFSPADLVYGEIQRRAMEGGGKVFALKVEVDLPVNFFECLGIMYKNAASGNGGELNQAARIDGENGYILFGTSNSVGHYDLWNVQHRYFGHSPQRKHKASILHLKGESAADVMFFDADADAPFRNFPWYRSTGPKTFEIVDESGGETSPIDAAYGMLGGRPEIFGGEVGIFKLSEEPVRSIFDFLNHERHHSSRLAIYMDIDNGRVILSRDMTIRHEVIYDDLARKFGEERPRLVAGFLLHDSYVEPERLTITLASYFRDEFTDERLEEEEWRNVTNGSVDLFEPNLISADGDLEKLSLVIGEETRTGGEGVARNGPAFRKVEEPVVTDPVDAPEGVEGEADRTAITHKLAVVMNDDKGFHTRVCGFLGVLVRDRPETSLFLEGDDIERFQVTTSISKLMLLPTRRGDRLTFTAEGPDAKTFLREISKFRLKDSVFLVENGITKKGGGGEGESGAGGVSGSGTGTPEIGGGANMSAFSGITEDMADPAAETWLGATYYNDMNAQFVPPDAHILSQIAALATEASISATIR